MVTHISPEPRADGLVAAHGAADVGADVAHPGRARSSAERAA